MAGDWIKMRADLHTHPKVVRMASALKADRLRIVGGLHSAWCLFDVHSVDGLLDGYSADTLDDLIGFPGFSRAMMAVGWLEENGESLVMPRFEAHNGQSAKRRAQDADRKRNVRKASASEADKKRTREEKRREDIKDKPHIGGEQNSPVDNSAGGGEPDPDVNNAMLNGYVAPGGMGEFGKFQMRDNWKPDPQFIQRAALWGITLKTEITSFELADFITYWKAEGKAFHHDQWQQKLARSVQQSRARPVAQQQRRDINDVPEPDKTIPQGFRGYQAT
ncbi:DnaT-like ssDNA-binding domain-containing protein [Enterobacter hormaechei]|uniref:DnaT-like ssDNA-binding domain-containing protein n=1 Tax=Enterobacter hormaechei TaxID=158836 RepID=UPI00079A03DC|nr:DnaT-like ssDNA-binding domain-containing protein [Enterobacter hormaechei]MBK4253980.1 Pyocin large subunit [Enterobacter hormaechei]MBK4443767.1 Pyocin large subunit [Enterobacter hormaechei]MBK4447675.1 Pyocin large subunit [Enterobacter hormaechei]MBK4508206.1 Pyocin large subunit [Enterobacter hormaechei]MBK4523992.1 Pyocin large subunit [Enterobacter hormaechei]